MDVDKANPEYIRILAPMSPTPVLPTDDASSWRKVVSR
jgi:hypothetical protein